MNIKLRSVGKTLAVASALLAGTAAFGQSRVSHFHVDIGTWTYIPIVEDDAAGTTCDAFVGFKTSAVTGSNIRAILYTRSSSGAWSGEAWTGVEPWDVVLHCKGRFDIPDSSDEAWLLDVDPASVDPGPGEPYAGGLLTTDPLQTIVASASSPEEILELLESVGYPATAEAIGAAAAEPICSPVIILDAMSLGVEGGEADPLINAEEEAQAAFAAANCNLPCMPWTWTTSGPTLLGCTCGPWVFSDGPWWVGGSQCSATCWFSTTTTCTYERTRTKRKSDCTTCTWTQTATSTKNGVKAKSVSFHPEPCTGLPPGYTCPAGPDNADCPSSGAPSGGWTPGPTC